MQRYEKIKYLIFIIIIFISPSCREPARNISSPTNIDSMGQGNFGAFPMRIFNSPMDLWKKSLQKCSKEQTLLEVVEPREEDINVLKAVRVRQDNTDIDMKQYYGFLNCFFFKKGHPLSLKTCLRNISMPSSF